jgi:hypothetical protein
LDNAEYQRENIRKWEEDSIVGDRFKDFTDGGWLDLLNEHIFSPLNKEAFELFKKVPAEDSNGIIESQMMSKMVDLIKGRIQSCIHQGQNAKAALIDIGEEDDT